MGCPKKMEVDHYGETGKAREEYYYENGELILYKNTHYFYEYPISEVQNSTITDSTKSIIYIDKGEIIRKENTSLTKEDIFEVSKKLLYIAGIE